MAVKGSDASVGTGASRAGARAAAEQGVDIYGKPLFQSRMKRETFFRPRRDIRVTDGLGADELMAAVLGAQGDEFTK